MIWFGDEQDDQNWVFNAQGIISTFIDKLLKVRSISSNHVGTFLARIHTISFFDAQS